MISTYGDNFLGLLQLFLWKSQVYLYILLYYSNKYGTTVPYLWSRAGPGAGPASSAPASPPQENFIFKRKGYDSRRSSPWDPP